MHVIIEAAVIFSKQVTLSTSKGMLVNFHTGDPTRPSVGDTLLIFKESKKKCPEVGQGKVQGSRRSFNLTKCMRDEHDGR